MGGNTWAGVWGIVGMCYCFWRVLFVVNMVKIPEFYPIETQTATIGKHTWSVARLITLAKDLPVMEVPLNHISIWHIYKDLTIREMVMHMRAVNDADLDYPIILDEDGEIMDGRHRVMKALLIEAETIKAVRFDENHMPCIISDENI